MKRVRLIGSLACVLAGSSLLAQSVASGASSWSQQILPDLGRTRDAIFDTNRAGVVFLSNEKLIAYGVEIDTSRLSSRSSPEVSSPFRLHMWVLDAKSGTRVLTKELGTRVHDTDVQVTTGGVLVKTGAVLKLYSSDFTNVRDLAVPLDKGWRIIANVSPSGKTILVNGINGGQNQSHLDVFEGDTLRNMYSWWDAGLYHDYSISDDGIAAARSYNSIGVATFGSTKWVALAQDRGCPWPWFSPTMIGSESFVARRCGELVLRTVAGTSHFLGSLDLVDPSPSLSGQCHPFDGGMNSKTAVASEGRFVAITLASAHVKKHILTEASACLSAVQIAVFDLVLKKRVFTVNVNPLPNSDYDFALSPDGSKLAILNDRVVSVVPADYRAR